MNQNILKDVIALAQASGMDIVEIPYDNFPNPKSEHLIGQHTTAQNIFDRITQDWKGGKFQKFYVCLYEFSLYAPNTPASKIVWKSTVN
jgi:hypothetical protein